MGEVVSQAEALIKLLKESRAASRAALDGLDQNTEVFPGWYVKHFLAHVAGWDEATVVSLRAHGQGDVYEIPVFRGIDDYNTQSVVTRHDLNHDQVYAEWEMVRRDLLTVLAALPAEKFEETFLLPWGHKGTVEQLVRIMADHELEHCHDLLLVRATGGPPGTGRNQ